MAKTITEMEVESVTLEAADTKTIRFRWPEGHDPEFKTGQFITIYWLDTPSYKRAYSLSSCALDRGYYDITVKRDGRMGTRLVDWIKAGDRLAVIAPTGRFLPVFEPGHHLVCIAGGSGVTPFRGFLREANLRKLDTRVTILYSVRTPADIIYREQFEALARENPLVRFLVTCTRLAEDDGTWTGRRGRLDAAWIREQVTDAERTVFYACGPNALVDAAEQLVVGDLGFAKERMKTEKWG